MCGVGKAVIGCEGAWECEKVDKLIKQINESVLGFQATEHTIRSRKIKTFHPLFNHGIHVT